MKIFMLCFALFSLFVNQKIAEAGIYNKRLYLIGSRAAGMAGNFNANADDGSALWYNPAGLAKMKGNSISISANTYSYYSTTVENFFNFQANGATETLHADDQRSDFVINPTALIYGFNTGISESVAFGIFSPTSEEMSGILDGQADQASEYRKIHMDYMFNKKTYIAMLGYGFELIPGINLGVNLGLSYSRYELQSYYFHYIYYKIHNHELNYIRQKKVSNFYYGIFSAVGFQFELSEKHKLGLSIKSPFLNLYNKKTETINNMDMNSSFINPSDDLFLEKETHDEFLHQTVPSSMNIGYSFHIPDLMVFSMNIFPSFSSPYSKDYENNVLDFGIGFELYLQKNLILNTGFITDFSQRPDIKSTDTLYSEKVNYYIFSFSLSLGNEIADDQYLWTQMGVTYRYGAGEIMGDDYPAVPSSVRDKTVHNIQVILSESIYF